MSIGEGTGTGFATLRGRDYPTIRQFTVFLENRVGQLLEVIRRFEGSRVRIVALSINDATECAFVRFLLSHPEQGREILERAGLAIIESDLIGLELPDRPNPLLEVCTALLQAEVNIDLAAFGGATLTSVTGGRDWDAVNGRDFDFSAADLIYMNPQEDESFNRFKTFSQEIRLAGATDSVDWLFGLFYANENLEKTETYRVGAAYEPYLSTLVGSSALPREPVSQTCSAPHQQT